MSVRVSATNNRYITFAGPGLFGPSPRRSGVGRSIVKSVDLLKSKSIWKMINEGAGMLFPSPLHTRDHSFFVFLSGRPHGVRGSVRRFEEIGV